MSTDDRIREIEERLEQPANLNLKFVQNALIDVRFLLDEVKRLKGDAQCDICAGAGKLLNSEKCVCGGLGLAIDTLHYFRVELLGVRNEVNRLREENHELRTQLQKHVAERALENAAKVTP